MWSASTEPTRHHANKTVDGNVGKDDKRGSPPQDEAIPEEQRSRRPLGPISHRGGADLDPTDPKPSASSHDNLAKRRRGRPGARLGAVSTMGVASKLASQKSGSGRSGGVDGMKSRGKKVRILWQYAPVGKIIIALLYAILLAYTAMVIIGPLILLPIDKAEWCPDYALVEADDAAMGGGSANDDDGDDGEGNTWGGTDYENPDYITDPCRYRRLPQLMGLTMEECDLSRRMLASVLFGGAIGYERRASDRPAGIRTMGLVSLGSCFFTISSQLAFKSSTMGWDASRVTAAIPSGVGFLGAGLIWKGTVGLGVDEVHQVHGLTTAASLWLSAAIGVGAGGALYFVSAYSVVLVMIILRYGPKLYFQDDASYNEEDDDDDSESGFDSDLSDNDLGSDRGGLDLDKSQELKLSGQFSAMGGAGNGSQRIFHPSWQKHVDETSVDRKVMADNGGGEDEMTQGDSCPSFVSYSSPYSKGDTGACEEGQKLQGENTAGYGTLRSSDAGEEHDLHSWSFRTLDDDVQDSKRVMFEEVPADLLRSDATSLYTSKRSKSIGSTKSKQSQSSRAKKKRKHRKVPNIRPSFHS